jgi:hypothetical protein
MPNKASGICITTFAVLLVLQCGKSQLYTRRSLRANYFALSMHAGSMAVKENVPVKVRYSFKNISGQLLVVPWFGHDYFYAKSITTSKTYFNSDILWDRTRKVVIGENGYTSDDIHLCPNAEINDSVIFGAYLPSGSYLLVFDNAEIPMKVTGTDTIRIDTLSADEIGSLMKPPRRNLESMLMSIAGKDTTETRRLLSRIAAIDTGWLSDSTRGFVRAMVNRNFPK